MSFSFTTAQLAPDKPNAQRKRVEFTDKLRLPFMPEVKLGVVPRSARTPRRDESLGDLRTQVCRRNRQEGHALVN